MSQKGAEDRAARARRILAEAERAVRREGPLGSGSLALRSLREKVRARLLNGGSLEARGSAALVSTDTLVSVIMTVFNKADHVQRSIDSILRQTHKNLELIIVDDCSTDGSYEIVRDFARRITKIRQFRNPVNRGTYWSKNFGITRASGTILTFQDADDISVSTRVERQLEMLGSGGVSGVIVSYERLDADGNARSIGGRTLRPALITLMFPRALVDELGYFDSVRMGADSELYQRIRKRFGASAVHRIQECLYVAQDTENSLTVQGPGRFDIDEATGRMKLPTIRTDYLKEFRQWHADTEGRVKITFPQISRPFPVDPRLLPAPNHDGAGQILASIASTPDKVDGLKNAIESILPQVDQLRVYLDGYADVPSFLEHDRITVDRSQAPRNADQNGSDRFAFAHPLPVGYHFGLRDDLVYPPTYVQHLMLKLDLYDDRCIVGVHGAVLGSPFESLAQGGTEFPAASALSRDVAVNLLDTGTFAYPTALLQFGAECFEQPGMGDVVVAAIARRVGVPMIAVERPAKWLEDVQAPARFLGEDDRGRTQILREAGDWSLEQTGGTFSLAARAMLDRAAPPSLEDRGASLDFLNGAAGRPELRVAVMVVGPASEEQLVQLVETMNRQQRNHYRLRVLLCDTRSREAPAEPIAELARSFDFEVVARLGDDNDTHARYVLLQKLEADEIGVFIDLDAELTDDALLRVTQAYHEHPECQFTYGNHHDADGTPNPLDFYAPGELEGRAYRSSEHFRFAAPLSFRGAVAQRIDASYFQNEAGEWLPQGFDVALAFGVVDQCAKDQVRVIPEPIYRFGDVCPAGSVTRIDINSLRRLQARMPVLLGSD